ncbi:MAG TPA: hypothetical protein VIE65_17820 [Methylobacter sp.]
MSIVVDPTILAVALLENLALQIKTALVRPVLPASAPIPMPACRDVNGPLERLSQTSMVTGVAQILQMGVIEARCSITNAIQ